MQALRCDRLTLYGGGRQTRSFCFLDDPVEGLIRLMNRPNTGPVNIGNPSKFTIKQLAELVRNRINPYLLFVEQPLPQVDPLQRQPVIDLTSAELDWAPTVYLETTIAYLRELPTP